MATLYVVVVVRRLRASEVYFGTQVQGIIYLRASVIRATCTVTRRTPHPPFERIASRAFNSRTGPAVWRLDHFL